MEKKKQAQQLYMAGGKSQKEIAETVGVSERTVHTWIHQYEWDKLRLAAFRAPVTIADNFCAQLVELQNDIATRPPGKRYPTLEEAEVSRKLIAALEKIKKYPSLSLNMQVLETFRNYVRPLDKEFASKIGRYSEQFLEGKSVNGYAPYQVEYGVEPVAPISPYYEEPDYEEPLTDDIDPPCPDINTCLHEGNCTYPHCQHKTKPKIDPVSRYTIPAVHYVPKPPVAIRNIPATPEAILIPLPPGTKSTFIRPPLALPPAVKTGSIPAISQPENHENDVTHVTQQQLPHSPLKNDQSDKEKSRGDS